jgi:hypothetical protein
MVRVSWNPSRSLRSFLLAVFGALACVGACGGGTASSKGAQLGDGAAEDRDGGEDSGRYRQGVYLCCAEGEGRACCPPETLPDPAVGRSATCFQYGGVRGACVRAGESLEGKDICALCCPGLTRVGSEKPSGDGGVCEPTAPPSVFFCAACGDDVCGDGENPCNCPADCK